MQVKRQQLELDMDNGCRVKESESEGRSVCLTLSDPMDDIVRGILQARILEWVAFPFSGESSQPRDPNQVSQIAGKFFPS